MTLDPEAHFRSVAPSYMHLLMADFGLSDLDAAAVFGNAGYESLGFTKLQEMKPTVKGSRGGWGWFQWTGPRRVSFEAYCKRNGLDPASDEANYKFLFVELTGTEKGALAKLKAAKTLKDKVVAFEAAFERAGVKAYAKRQRWAQIALDAFNASPVPVPPPVEEYEEPIAGTPVPPQRPGWGAIAFIAVLSVAVAIAVWLGGQPEAAEVSLFSPQPMPAGYGLVGGGGIWADIAMQIALSFVAPLVSAAATAIVGWIGWQWQRWLKADFDSKSAAQLHAALERGILAAIETFGTRASKAKLISSAADYVETFNPDAAKRLGREKIELLAVPHLALAKKR